MAFVARAVARDTGEDLAAILNAEATRGGMPPELLLALAIAESALNVRSERWGHRTSAARAALAAGDQAALASIVAAVERETPGDISFGLFQQTVRWADEGDRSARLENVLFIRDRYFAPQHATAVAARRLGGYWRSTGDPLEALCRYNKPTWPAADNPYRDRYRRALEQARAYLTSERQPVGPVQLEIRLSPNFEPGRPRTIGVVVHSTRGGTTSADDDYRATLNWFARADSRASAHVVVGPSRACRMVADADTAWHAGENNRTHLGIEIAQPRPDSPFEDGQYRLAAAVVRDWCLAFELPIERVTSQATLGIVGHEDTEQGRRHGKSDPGPAFDWDRFIGLVRDPGAAVVRSAWSIGEGFGAFLADHPEAGQPRHDEAHDLYGNAYLWLTPTAVYPRGALLLWRRWLNRVELVPWEADADGPVAGSLEAFLASHPELGQPRHPAQSDLFGNRYVWLAPSPGYPLGPLVYWRRWLDAVRLIPWSATRGQDAGGGRQRRTSSQPTANRSVTAVVAQCQVERANYDSEEDYLVWAGPRADGTFDTASCAAAALAALLTAYGVPTNISAAVRVLGPGRISPDVGLRDASLAGMREALAEIGVPAERGDLAYDDLLAWLATGTPVILNLPRRYGGMGHILVAVAGDADGCELADSARRERPRWRAGRGELEGYSSRVDRRLAGLRIVSADAIGESLSGDPDV